MSVTTREGGHGVRGMAREECPQRHGAALAGRAVAAALALAGCGAEPGPTYVDAREPCADRNPRRNLYFGDLHVHTAYSFDAWVHDVRADPADAYAFARGAEIEGRRIDRPLDFAAVTDHSEFLAEVEGCTTPGSAVYDLQRCVTFRAGTPASLVGFGIELDDPMPARFEDLCGPEGIDCPGRAEAVWRRTIEAAEAAYDRSSACEFTSLIGYEWSGSVGLSNLHRNVIFRTSATPRAPVTHFEAPSAGELWRRLQEECRDALPGCEVLAIPHGTNWSNGNLFFPEGDATQAEIRADLEPLLEIYQHKGDAECSAGVSGIGGPDELCSFEKLRLPPFDDCGEGTGSQGMVGRGCVSRLDFLRGVLLAGLKEERRIGVNPYRVGVIASTDTHNGTPGMVRETSYTGHVGKQEGDALARLTGAVPAGPRNSPGGLVAVWAEENSREAIFDALQRREVYGTSGPRIAVRVFGGWELPDDLCSSGDFVARGDAAGVPMGAEAKPRPGPEDRWTIAVSASRDPTSAPLERVQVIKGWLDAEGAGQIAVFDVAGGPGGAKVDASTCQKESTGADLLCAVWRDPDFNPERPAFYYVRVVEDPVCRWSWLDCLRLPAAERPAACSDPTIARVIQERAWTSPIWVSPR